MADKSQPLVRDFFSKVDPDEFLSQISSDSTPTLDVTGEDDGGLPTDYKSVGDGIVHDEEWDETAELLISDEVKANEVEKSGMSGVKIKSSEVGGSEAKNSEVEDYGMESSEVEESETEGNKTEESDHFEDL